jgi:hypothetical protein
VNLEQALINNGSAADLDEARRLISEMRSRVVDDLEDPEEVLLDYGLEPDYVMDLLF